MSGEAHIRIDEGIRRGKRAKIQPAALERKTRDEAGKFLTRYTPELKAQALQEALSALEGGGRVEAVAKRLQVPVSTMYSWLVGCEQAAKMRTQFFDGQVVRNLQEIRSAREPLELARAREELSGWIKVAERRDPKSYALKQEVVHSGTVTFSHALQEISQRRLGPSAVQLPQSTIDITPEQPKES